MKKNTSRLGRLQFLMRTRARNLCPCSFWEPRIVQFGRTRVYNDSTICVLDSLFTLWNQSTPDSKELAYHSPFNFTVMICDREIYYEKWCRAHRAYARCQKGKTRAIGLCLECGNIHNKQLAPEIAPLDTSALGE